MLFRLWALATIQSIPKNVLNQSGYRDGNCLANSPYTLLPSYFADWRNHKDNFHSYTAILLFSLLFSIVRSSIYVMDMH